MKLSFIEKFLLSLYNASDALLNPIPWPPSMKKALYEARHLNLKKLWQSYNQEYGHWSSFKKVLSYLKRRGYIKIKELENKQAIILTPKGATKLEKIALKIKCNKKRRDGKWQMVIFDIPEKKRFARDQLRWALKNLGYQRFQKSIWICPYNVLEETQNLIKNLSLKSYVRLLLIEEMVIS